MSPHLIKQLSFITSYRPILYIEIAHCVHVPCSVALVIYFALRKGSRLSNEKAIQASIWLGLTSPLDM